MLVFNFSSGNSIVQPTLRNTAPKCSIKYHQFHEFVNSFHFPKGNMSHSLPCLLEFSCLVRLAPHSTDGNIVGVALRQYLEAAVNQVELAKLKQN